MTLPAVTEKIERVFRIFFSYFNSLNILKGLLAQNVVSNLYAYLTEINSSVNIFLR